MGGRLNFGPYQVRYTDGIRFFLELTNGDDVGVDPISLWSDFTQTQEYIDFIAANPLFDPAAARNPGDPSAPVAFGRVYSMGGDDYIRTDSTGGGLYGEDGDSTLEGQALAGSGQIHFYGGDGDETILMSFLGIDGQNARNHGHHAEADGGTLYVGRDTFEFADTAEVSNGAVVVGRIEDFDYSRDRIVIEGLELDLLNLPSNVRIVEFDGVTYDTPSDTQQWLLIETATGGYIFYALEGARVDMGGIGGSQQQEKHFIDPVDLPKNANGQIDFSSLQDVTFVDQKNTVPDGYTPDGGVIIQDRDYVISDVLQIINGTQSGDLIAAGLNNDSVTADDGNDHVWGGGGDDDLYGGDGNDYLEGGTGNDTLNGGANDDTLTGGLGDDVFEGGSGNDVIFANEGGADIARGGDGDDGIFFGAALDASDVIDGGAGEDQLALQGDYSFGLTFGTNTTAGIEMVVLLPGNITDYGAPGTEFYNYDLTLIDANVSPGQLLSFQANVLRAGESFTLNASAVTDGGVLTFGGLGNEVLTGGADTDGFFFGTDRFTAGDRVDGLSGMYDSVGLQGDYSDLLTIGEEQFANIDVLALLSSTDTRFGAGSNADFHYNIETSDGNVAAGETLIVNSNQLTADETLTFNGEAETDGQYSIFSGNGADNIEGSHGNDLIYGGAGADIIKGNAGDDTLIGGAGTDRLNGNGGADTFVFSTGHERDNVIDFNPTEDVLDLRGTGLTGLSELTPLTNVSGSNWIYFDFGGSDVLWVKNISLSDLNTDKVLFA